MILAIFMTGIIYMAYPLWYVSQNGKQTSGRAWKIALINFLICHTLFIVFSILLIPNATASTTTAPVLWLFVSQVYLTDKNLTKEEEHFKKTEPTKIDTSESNQNAEKDEKFIDKDTNIKSDI